ncbi:MAG: hypothetical protein KDK08_22375 [Rhizobiaceae bacterium]|nr:hypothetical protein [Rhizobiaceae bacterium]
MPAAYRIALLLIAAFVFPMALVVTASAVTSMVPGLQIDGRLLCSSENRLVRGYFRPVCTLVGDGAPVGGGQCYEVHTIRTALTDRMWQLYGQEFEGQSEVQNFIQSIENKTPSEDASSIQLCGGTGANELVGQILGLSVVR